MQKNAKLENNTEVPRNLKTEPVGDPAIQRKWRQQTKEVTVHSCHLTVAKTQNRPGCLSKDEWIKKFSQEEGGNPTMSIRRDGSGELFMKKEKPDTESQVACVFPSRVETKQRKKEIWPENKTGTGRTGKEIGKRGRRALERTDVIKAWFVYAMPWRDPLT